MSSGLRPTSPVRSTPRGGSKTLRFTNSVFGFSMRYRSVDKMQERRGAVVKQVGESSENRAMFGVGDRLVSVNGVDVRSSKFSDILSLVQDAAASASPEVPSVLVFEQVKFARHESGHVLASTSSFHDNAIDTVVVQFATKPLGIKLRNRRVVATVPGSDASHHVALGDLVVAVNDIPIKPDFSNAVVDRIIGQECAKMSSAAPLSLELKRRVKRAPMSSMGSMGDLDAIAFEIEEEEEKHAGRESRAPRAELPEVGTRKVSSFDVTFVEAPTGIKLMNGRVVSVGTGSPAYGKVQLGDNLATVNGSDVSGLSDADLQKATSEAVAHASADAPAQFTFHRAEEPIVGETLSETKTYDVVFNTAPFYLKFAPVPNSVGTMVYAVDERCPHRSKIRTGDQLVEYDGEDVSKVHPRVLYEIIKSKPASEDSPRSMKFEAPTVSWKLQRAPHPGLAGGDFEEVDEDPTGGLLEVEDEVGEFSSRDDGEETKAKYEALRDLPAAHTTLHFAPAVLGKYTVGALRGKLEASTGRSVKQLTVLKQVDEDIVKVVDDISSPAFNPKTLKAAGFTQTTLVGIVWA